jgi:predicted esterase
MITRSVKRIVRLIHKEIQDQGGNSRRIFLGGWSLGVTIAITAFLRLPETFGPLGGVFCSSGSFCAVVDWTDVAVEMKKRTPIVFYHGEEDTLFERWYAQHTYKRLMKEGELKYKFIAERDLGH